MKKFLNNLIDAVATVLLLPIILAVRLISMLVFVAMIIIICTSPFILIGYIVWIIAR